MGELKLINGKFFRDKVEVKPEIGNIEQINLLRSLGYYKINNEEEIEEDKPEGIIVDIDYNTIINAEIRFKCYCGKTIWKDYEDLRDEDYGELIDNKIICKICSREYILVDGDNELIVELIKK